MLKTPLLFLFFLFAPVFSLPAQCPEFPCEKDYSIQTGDTDADGLPDTLNYCNVSNRGINNYWCFSFQKGSKQLEFYRFLADYESIGVTYLPQQLDNTKFWQLFQPSWNLAQRPSPDPALQWLTEVLSDTLPSPPALFEKVMFFTPTAQNSLKIPGYYYLKSKDNKLQRLLFPGKRHPGRVPLIYYYGGRHRIEYNQDFLLADSIEVNGLDWKLYRSSIGLVLNVGNKYFWIFNGDLRLSEAYSQLSHRTFFGKLVGAHFAHGYVWIQWPREFPAVIDVKRGACFFFKKPVISILPDKIISTQDTFSIEELHREMARYAVKYPQLAVPDTKNALLMPERNNSRANEDTVHQWIKWDQVQKPQAPAPDYFTYAAALLLLLVVAGVVYLALKK